MFAEAALSSGQQAIITRGLRKMQNDKIVLTQNEVQIFGQPKTLLKWADRLGDGEGFGATPTTYFLDCSAMLQGTSHVSLVILNPLHTVQRILLKNEYPDSALHVGNGEVLTFIDGASAVGGQVHQNKVYRDRCKSFPKENGKIAVALASDKLLASGRTSYPVYLQVLSIDSAFAMIACELLGFFPVPPRRKPHGSKFHERLSREQHEAFLQVHNKATALRFYVCNLTNPSYR
jgi:hypothetical protein